MTPSASQDEIVPLGLTANMIVHIDWGFGRLLFSGVGPRLRCPLACAFTICRMRLPSRRGTIFCKAP